MPLGGGKRTDGFAARVESEVAWKIDFKSLKLAAEAKAKPHWDKAETLGNEASALANELKGLRESVKNEKKKPVREKSEAIIAVLNEKLDLLRQQSKEQQSIGDRHYWPIYNLDIKNPNAPEEETHDADKLLAKYKVLLSEIEKTQNKLKAELADALSHHTETAKQA